MNNKLQDLRGKIKVKFYQIVSNYYDETNIGRQKTTFQFEEDPYSKNAEFISKINYEVLLLMIFYRLNLTLKKRIISIMYYILPLIRIEMVKKL